MQCYVPMYNGRYQAHGVSEYRLGTEICIRNRKVAATCIIGDCAPISSQKKTIDDTDLLLLYPGGTKLAGSAVL